MRESFDALLLDLDGTLVGLDYGFFRGTYVEAVAAHFSAFDLEFFRDALWGAFYEIMERPRENGESNEAGFLRAFARATGMGEGEARGRFAAFYRESFPALSAHARAIPMAAELVTAASDAGYRLVLATNPIFPRAANVGRLAWVGIGPGAFDLIPGIEDFSTCKPQPGFFLRCAEAVGVPPARCLMVGNDEEQDLPAQDAGMRTFLVSTYRISRGRSRGKPWREGDIEALGKLLHLW
jgi:FMN phosphatase YigB (HAD superfamily)